MAQNGEKFKSTTKSMFVIQRVASHSISELETQLLLKIQIFFRMLAESFFLFKKIWIQIERLHFPMISHHLGIYFKGPISISI